jgi:hypothetical protein
MVSSWSAGVTGIGLDSSKVALYEDEQGDRGVLCQEVGC